MNANTKGSRNPRLSLYLKDFDNKLVYFLLVLSSLVYLFRDLAINKARKYLVDPFLSHFSQGWQTDYIVIALGVFAIVHMIRQLFFTRVLPTLNSVVLFTLVFGIYLLVFSEGVFEYYYYTNQHLTNFRYSTTILIGLFVFFASYRSYKNPLKKPLSKFFLSDDNSLPKNYTDHYGNEGYANNISKFISGTSSEVSVSIGIFGGWGSGKTDLLKRIKRALDKDSPDENITIEFNPWKHQNQHSITSSFFDILAESLRPYNKSIGKTLRSYSSKILGDSENMLFRSINSLLNNFSDDSDGEEYDKINETIKRTGKRIVVFIDDMDRLTGDEVLGLLKLIRNTASFSNTFFVLGVDRDYIIKVIENSKAIHNEEQYLDKIFQLQLILPIQKKDFYLKIIKELLLTDDYTEPEKTKINAIIDFTYQESSLTFGVDTYTSETFIEELLNNVRDIKRFCNSFKVSYNLIGDIVDPHDLFVLELIKANNHFILENLKTQSLIKISGNVNKRNFQFNRDIWNNIVEQRNLENAYNLESAIEFILTSYPFKNAARFGLIHNYYLYFSYKLFDLIPIKDFKAAMDKDEDGMFADFSLWASEKQLDSILVTIEHFENEVVFKRFIHVLLRLNSENSYNHAHRLVVIHLSKYFSLYFGDSKELFSEFIDSVFKSDKIAYLTRAKFIESLLKKLARTDFLSTYLTKTKIEIKYQIYQLFYSYLNKLNDNPNYAEIMEFYYLNKDRVMIETDQILISTEANNAFEAKLLENDNIFRNYFENLIRPYNTPYNGTFTFEPFLPQIFGDWTVFEEKLKEQNFEDENLERLKKITLKYIEKNFSSNPKAFIITEYEDRLFVEEYLGLDN